MGPLLAIEIQVFEVRPAASSEWWTTALVAVVAALLGAVVGGIATFVANDRMESRRRLARASIRRKAKVYTPIRHELIALTRAIDDDNAHLRFGIHTDPPNDRSRLLEPRVFLWGEMKRDGRGLSSAAANVRVALDAVDKEIGTLNKQRAEAMDVFDRQGRIHFESATGAPTRMTHWVSGSTLGQFVRSEYATGGLFGFGQTPDEENRAQAAFAEKCSNDPDIQTAIANLQRATESVRSKSLEAVEILEAAMDRIAKRYEGEVVRD